MATGVQPRDDDFQFSRTDLETIQDALKNQKFREMLKEYCDEVRDPANQALYQKEMTQLEKERGYDVTFINPKGGYVIKTSVAGDRKAFINICSNDNVAKPSCNVQEVNGQRGMNWQIPYSMIPPREDYNDKKERCVIYDVVFHPDTLRMAEVNKRFRELVNKTALEALQKTYDIHLDNNNCRFPKSHYKGMAVPAVIRKEDPDYVPPTDEEMEAMTPEMIEKLYPQRTYSQTSTTRDIQTSTTKETENKTKAEPRVASKLEPFQQKRKVRRGPVEFTHATDHGYTIPKYVIKQQKNVDMQDFTYNKDCKQYSAIPSQIVVEVSLPLLSSTKDCTLDVQEKSLLLKSEKPAKYKLNIPLPYSVNDECGTAKFDKSKNKLIVTLPVIRRNVPAGNNNNSLKVDSGVESEDNSGSQSEEDNSKENLIVELSSTPAELVVQAPEPNPVEVKFFNPSLSHTLPSYTHNVLDDIIALTFHVKNTEPDSVKVNKNGNKISIKFTSIGAGFVPAHYGAIIVFDEQVHFDNVTGEAWDNNVILQLELAGKLPQKFQIGLSEDTMKTEYFDGSQVNKTVKTEPETAESKEEEMSPVVEVTNLGTETNIVVSSTTSEYDEDDDDLESPSAKDDDVFNENELGLIENGAKSILRKSMPMMRSFSESSAGDIASSMDYISSDCVPEESSLKKTVRFNDVPQRQFYRYNSSIEGQKKKNQRKKSKKRNQDQRKSESEAEDDLSNLSKISKPKLKPVLKPRRDSGLADTSDAETDCNQSPLEYQSSADANKDDNEMNTPDETKTMIQENEINDTDTSVLNILDTRGNDNGNPEPVIWESVPSESTSLNVSEKAEKSEPVTSENIKHNTDLYNPDRLNKGQYLEVAFKNDLIFDLDM